MTVHFHQDDLPEGLNFGDGVAIDTETMGLAPHRDRLCLVQLSAGDGEAHLVRIAPGKPTAPRLCKLLGDPKLLKIFHYARFDIAVLQHALGVMTSPVYCTKIASKLTRTYTDRHGLKDLCRELLGIDISKQQQSSDWGAETLSEEQLQYAAADVLHLHALKQKLNDTLRRENRLALAQAAFDYLPTRALFDLMAGESYDPLTH